MSVRDKLRDGAYENTRPYATRKDDDQAWTAYHLEEARCLKAFREDLETECGTRGHAKADKLWAIAWDMGHPAGLHEVLGYYVTIVELVR